MVQKSAEIETKVQEKTSKSQHYKIASMGDGVDDWLILTAIQKSLIHYSYIKVFISQSSLRPQLTCAELKMISHQYRKLNKKDRHTTCLFYLARERFELSTSRV